MKKTFFIILLLSMPQLSYSMNKKSPGKPKPLSGRIEKKTSKKAIAMPSPTNTIIQYLNNSLWNVAIAEERIKSALSSPIKDLLLLSETVSLLTATVSNMYHAGNAINTLETYNKDTKKEFVHIIETINTSIMNNVTLLINHIQNFSTIPKDFDSHIAQYKEDIVNIWDVIALKTALPRSSMKQIYQETERTHGNGIATIFIENAPVKTNPASL